MDSLCVKKFNHIALYHMTPTSDTLDLHRRDVKFITLQYLNFLPWMICCKYILFLSVLLLRRTMSFK